MECAGQDRQDTRLAYQLFSDKTAALFRRFYPDTDDSKMAAADYCDLSHKGRVSTHILSESTSAYLFFNVMCVMSSVNSSIVQF